MGMNSKRQSAGPQRAHQLDEETLGSILLEVNSLRNSLVELQHHLIGVSSLRTI